MNRLAVRRAGRQPRLSTRRGRTVPRGGGASTGIQGNLGGCRTGPRFVPVVPGTLRRNPATMIAGPPRGWVRSSHCGRRGPRAEDGDPGTPSVPSREPAPGSEGRGDDRGEDGASRARVTFVRWSVVLGPWSVVFVRWSVVGGPWSVGTGGGSAGAMASFVGSVRPRFVCLGRPGGGSGGAMASFVRSIVCCPWSLVTETDSMRAMASSDTSRASRSPAGSTAAGSAPVARRSDPSTNSLSDDGPGRSDNGAGRSRQVVAEIPADLAQLVERPVQRPAARRLVLPQPVHRLLGVVGQPGRDVRRGRPPPPRRGPPAAPPAAPRPPPRSPAAPPGPPPRPAATARPAPPRTCSASRCALGLPPRGGAGRQRLGEDVRALRVHRVAGQVDRHHRLDRRPASSGCLPSSRIARSRSSRLPGPPLVEELPQRGPSLQQPGAPRRGGLQRRRPTGRDVRGCSGSNGQERSGASSSSPTPIGVGAGRAFGGVRNSVAPSSATSSARWSASSSIASTSRATSARSARSSCQEAWTARSTR